ncbi:hypothetical protein EGM51_04070 [Verrucomicrobia bacterium S94]|nr:hypothetical protein EGM51_04070 [Verrucomicrobia bacterium S94]
MLNEAKQAKAIERGVERAVFRALGGTKFGNNLAQTLGTNLRNGMEAGMMRAMRLDPEPFCKVIGETLAQMEDDVAKLTHSIGLAFTESADRMSTHFEHTLDDIPGALSITPKEESETAGLSLDLAGHDNEE